MTKHRHIYRQKRTAVFILLAAVLICAAVCRRSGGEEAEPEREKGLTAYVLRADTAIYMEFGVRNEFLRVLHGGELSGELLLSARSGDTVVSARRAYSTAEADQTPPRWSIRSFRRAKKPAISEYRSESRALPVSLKLKYMEGNRTENFQSGGLSGSSRMLFCTENPRCS